MASRALGKTPHYSPWPGRPQRSDNPLLSLHSRHHFLWAPENCKGISGLRVFALTFGLSLKALSQIITRSFLSFRSQMKVMFQDRIFSPGTQSQQRLPSPPKSLSSTSLCTVCIIALPDVSSFVYFVTCFLLFSFSTHRESRIFVPLVNPIS